MTLESVRFENELVPFEAAIRPWLNTSDPVLLPLVEKDYRALREMWLGPCVNQQKPLYIAAAGAPCSGKSTELEFELNGGEDPRYRTTAKIDPDRYTMEYMNHTYRPLVSASRRAELGTEEALKQAYEAARPGSNVIANLLLNEAYENRYNIVHGTTLTGNAAGSLLNKLGHAGYERRLLLCSATPEVREQAARKRVDQDGVYQVTPEDFVEKEKAYAKQMPTYFEQGDHVILLWKSALAEKAVKAAEYKNGERVILNQNAFDAFVKNYEQQRDNLKSEEVKLQPWEDIEKIYFDRAPLLQARLRSDFPLGR